MVLSILLGLGFWQFSFVTTAVSANPALNLVIFATFLFGLTLVGFAITSLRNEFRSLYALIERHEDAMRDAEQLGVDPYWRYYRCAKVGIVIRKPRVLGQSYQLISEQLSRTGDLQISTSTMKTLVEGIDERLSESRSLISYVAGILIFLGLIGTFIGLMVTLASVGDILGGLDLSGGDPAATVSSLMTNLQTPLGGMATGFSSSLFGLVTSLSISIMLQLLGRAGGRLKEDFSNWLTNVVELHEGESRAPVRAGETGSAAFEERRLALIMRTARYAVQASQRQSRQMDALREAISASQSQTLAQSASIDELAKGMCQMAAQQVYVTKMLGHTRNALVKLSKAADLGTEIEAFSTALTNELDQRDTRMLQNLNQIRTQLTQLSTSASEGEAAFDREAESLKSALDEHTDELNVGQLNKLLSAVYCKEGDAVVAEVQGVDGKRGTA